MSKLKISPVKPQSAISSKSSRSPELAVFLLVVIGAILRIIFLSKEGLWLDEATASWFANGPLERALNAESTNPPLYYLILHFWIKCFGNSELALRTLSVIPSVLAIPVFFGFAKRLLSIRGALIATAILTFSPFQIAYAQEARTFALLSLLLLLSSSWCFEILSADRPLRSTRGTIHYVCWTAAALYAHFISIFFVFAQNIYFALRFILVKRDRTLSLIWPWIKIQLLIGCLYLPWLLKMFAAVRGEGQVRRHLLLKIPQTFVSFLYGDTLIPLDEVAVKNIIPTLIANWYLLVAAGIGVIVIFLGLLRRMELRRYSALFLSVMVVVPLLSSFCVSMKIAFFDERYLIGVSLFLFVFCGWSLDNLITDLKNNERYSRTNLALGGVVPAMLVALSLYHYYFDNRFGKEQWREVVADLEVQYGDDELVVLDQDFLLPAYSYYSTKQVSIVKLIPEARDETGVAWQQIADKLKTRHGFWLIRSHFSDDLFLERLRATFKERNLRWYQKDKGIWVYRMEKQ